MQTIFQALIRDTNTVLRRLAADDHAPDWAVNWGDLSCRQAAAGVDDVGGPFIAVWVEEAAPDNYAFWEAIAGGLADLRWPSVQVYTEW